jgi:hypothetical protein
VPLTLYHVVKSRAPGAEDFKSQRELGNPSHTDPPAQEYDGVSFTDRLEQSVDLARRWPRMGDYVAEVFIPDGSPLTCEPTFGPGHWTVYGPRETMASYATRVVHKNDC